MNIEDRLRSHLHSGDELFVESSTDAGAISAAGRRRTRRNQIGGAAAGGVLAFGLVFGLTSIGGDEPDDFVSEALPEAAELEADSRVMADDFEMESQALEQAGIDEVAADESADMSMAIDFFEHEAIVGVGDGFAGLRVTEEGIVALRSDDGLEFSTSETTGIPEGAEVTTLVHRNGVFAAPFASFDISSAQTTSYIGTSTDLTSWTVQEVDLGDEFSEPFLGEVGLFVDGVIAVVTASQPFDEDAETISEPSIFILGGSVDGPYTAERLRLTGFGVSQLRAAGEFAMLTASTDSGADVWARADGEWSMVRQFPFDKFPTLVASGADIYLSTSSGVERSSNGGRTWTGLAVPSSVDERSSSANAVAGDSAVAVLFGLTDDVGMNVGYVLAAGAGDELTEASLEGLVPERAFVSLVAVSEDEALIEVFPEPDEFDEDLAASGGLVEEGGTSSPEPRYVRVPIG